MLHSDSLKITEVSKNFFIHGCFNLKSSLITWLSVSSLSPRIVTLTLLSTKPSVWVGVLNKTKKPHPENIRQVLDQTTELELQRKEKSTHPTEWLMSGVQRSSPDSDKVWRRPNALKTSLRLPARRSAHFWNHLLTVKKTLDRHLGVSKWCSTI